MSRTASIGTILLTESLTPHHPTTQDDRIRSKGAPVTHRESIT